MKWQVTFRLGIILVSLLFAAGVYDVSAATPERVTRVQFKLGADCMCASCGFSTQGMLRKLPGVSAVNLSVREKILNVSFDDARTQLSDVAATLDASPLGPGSMLIGTPAAGASLPSVKTLQTVPGVKTAVVDPKKSKLLIKLASVPRQTAAALAAALAKVGARVTFGSG